MSYALFAYQKKEWIEHRLRQSGAAPTQSEIDAWISELSDFQFRNMRKEAARLFDDAARSYLQEEVEKGKQEALEAAVVKRVESAGRSGNNSRSLC